MPPCHPFTVEMFPEDTYSDPVRATAAANCQQGTTVWHKHRGKYLYTGSTSAGLLGLGKFTKAADLVDRWDKTAHRTVSMAMYRGSAREEAIAALVTTKGRVVAPVEELRSVGILALPLTYLVPLGGSVDDFARGGFGVSPDGVGVTKTDGTPQWALEIKAPNSGRFSSHSRFDSSAHAYIDKNPQYTVQLWLEMLALAVPRAFFAVYWPNGWSVVQMPRADLVEAPIETAVAEGVIFAADVELYAPFYDQDTRRWTGLARLFCAHIARDFYLEYRARRAEYSVGSEPPGFWDKALLPSNDAARLVRWVLARATTAAVAHRSQDIDLKGVPYYGQAFTHELWLAKVLRERRPPRMADLKPHQFVLVDTRLADASVAVQHAVAAVAATGGEALTAVPPSIAQFEHDLLHVHFVHQTSPPVGRVAARYRISTHVVPATDGRHACTWYPFMSNQTIPFPSIVVATWLRVGGALEADTKPLANEGVDVSLFGGRVVLAVEPIIGSIHRALLVSGFSEETNN
jgi:hypothetical protein